MLGLDLQGGIEVRLEPVGKQRPSAVLDKAVDIIRNRVNGLGVAETEVKRDGDQIVVDLPGVKDRDKARRLVGKTAELRFRPVLDALRVPCKRPPTSTTSSTRTSSTSSSTTSPPRRPPAPPAGRARASGPRARATPPPSTSATTATTRGGAPPTTPPRRPPTTAPATAPRHPAAVDAGAGQAQRHRRAVRPRRQVRLPARPDRAHRQARRRRPTPSSTAGAAAAGSWSSTFNGTGKAKFNQLAATSFSKTPPQNAVAIVLDGVVQSAPAFQTPIFDGDVEISGNFSQTDAEDLATVLKFGSLPVQLKELTTTSVSPTLGRDQLDAGLLAGVIGLALVALYMLVFYRLLGLVVLGGLALSGMAIYTMITYLGDSIGLTLTLAGVVGLIVSVGITVDSYVVYFERLKDEVRTGRTVRSSVDRGLRPVVQDDPRRRPRVAHRAPRSSTGGPSARCASSRSCSACRRSSTCCSRTSTCTRGAVPGPRTGRS